jgi:hypothetical protein
VALAEAHCYAAFSSLILLAKRVVEYLQLLLLNFPTADDRDAYRLGRFDRLQSGG